MLELNLEPKVIIEPSREPLTLAQVKEHCRVSTTEQDAKLTRLIKVAREAAEKYMNRCLIQRTLRWYSSSWPTDRLIVMPTCPVQSIVSVSYVDEDGADQVLDPAKYKLIADDSDAYLVLARTETWPYLDIDNPQAVVIDFVAGYESTGSPGDAGLYKIPSPIIEAMLMQISDLNEIREEHVIGTTIEEFSPVGQMLHYYRTRIGV